MPQLSQGLDTEYIDVPYAPIGGVNYADPEDSLGEGEVADSLNMLFEHKICANRPGLNTVPGTVFNKMARFSFGVRTQNLNLLIDSTGGLWKWGTYPPTGTQLTGPITNFGSHFLMNADVVNEVVLVGNNIGGILRWDPTTNVYTQLANANYRYVRGHLSRAIGAFKQSGALADPITFAWSVAGDETDWTTAPSSGSITITDAPDQITGLEVLENVVAIPRQTGIHLAFPTGVAVPSAYRVETLLRNSAGFPYPSTICSESNIMFGLGVDDVYRFSMAEGLKSIGYKVRQKIFQDIVNSGNTNPFIGFTTRYDFTGATFSPKPRFRYHLITLEQNPTKHYCYSIDENQWSVHQYNIKVQAGFDSLYGFGPLGLVIIDDAVPPNFSVWNTDTVCEAASFVTGPVHIIGQPEIDVLLQRVLIKARDFGATNVTLSFAAKLGYSNVLSTPITQSFGVNNDFKLVRQWFDAMQANASGQSIQLTISVPAGKRFASNYYNLRCTLSGDYRGA